MATPLRHAPVALVALLLLVVPTAGLAAWPHDPYVNLPVCLADDGQNTPVAVSDGAGGIIVAWQDFRSGAYDIYAQRISHAGVALWGEDGVAVCTAAGVQMPSICDAFCVWNSLNTSSGSIW